MGGRFLIRYLVFMLLLLQGCAAMGTIATSTVANALGNVIGEKLEEAYDKTSDEGN